MGVCSVHSIAIPDGRSGQQVVDGICKQLEVLGARKSGTFCVECDTYYSAAFITPARVLNLFHNSEYPASCFALLDNGQSLIADASFDAILSNLSNMYTSKKVTRIECKGQRYTLSDFTIKIGSCTVGPSLKGVIVELEYTACVVPNSCWDLIKELAQSFLGTNVIQPHQYIHGRMNETYSPIDTIHQYNDLFNTLRKATTTVANIKT